MLFRHVIWKVLCGSAADSHGQEQRRSRVKIRKPSGKAELFRK
jgi:hypothetical protein